MLINDLVIKRTERTTTHTQHITESISNKEEDMRDEDSPSSANLSTVGQRPAVKLPKLEIVKFRGDYTKWQSFIDRFKAAIHSSETLSNIDKINYLQCYVTGDALNTIEGLSLMNDNYIKALELLEDRYGNKQSIIAAHTKNLLKLQRVESNLDVISLRRLYDDVQAQVRSLQSLGITEENYGTFLALIILELLPHEVQLNINRTLDEELWNLTRLLMIIKCEINAREKCTTAMEQERVGKNVFSSEELLSAASLFAGQKSKPLCVFCEKPHWSDKCRTISDPSSRKQFLKQGGYYFLCLKEDHKIRDCKRIVFTARVTQFRYLF